MLARCNEYNSRRCGQGCQHAKRHEWKDWCRPGYCNARKIAVQCVRIRRSSNARLDRPEGVKEMP